MFVAIATITSASAMNLKEAFNAISNVQNVTVVAPDYNLPVTADPIQNMQLAAGYNMNKEQIFESATAVFTLLNQVPMANIINGGTNNQVAAYVYATPNAFGSNDVLIVAMSGFKGSVVAIYGTMDDASVAAIKAAPLKIEGSFLSLEAKMADDTEFNIILNKAR